MAKKTKKKAAQKAAPTKKGPSADKIRAEIQEYKDLIATEGVPQDEKDFAAGEITSLEAQLKELETAPPPAAKAEPKKPAPSKPAKAAAAKKAAPKNQFGEDKSCDELRELYEQRRADRKKYDKKHKTVSVSERIGADIARAVGKAIDDIPAAKIKANPGKYIKSLEKVETGFKEAISELKSLLGEDYDRKELLQPFEETVSEFIKTIKEKYTK